MKLVAINENGIRMGEGHGRAKLTDHDVAQVQSLLECRDMLIEEYQKVGLSIGHIHRVLHEKQLSLGHIAAKFEVSKSQVRRIWLGEQRLHVAARWKRVCEPQKKLELVGPGRVSGPSVKGPIDEFVCGSCVRSHKNDAKHTPLPNGNWQCVHCATKKRRKAQRVKKSYLGWRPPE